MADAALKPEDVPEIGPLYRLQWEEAQQAYVLLFPEGMVKLNPAAGEILKRIDGATPVAGIVASLERVFPGVELRQDVLDFLKVAHERGWIRPR